MNKKDNELNFLIAFGILTIIGIGNFFLILNEYNRHHNKKGLTKDTEDKIIFINRIIYILLAYYFFTYSKNNYQNIKDKNISKEIKESEYRQLIVTFLILVSAFINITVYNYEIGDIYE